MTNEIIIINITLHLLAVLALGLEAKDLSRIKPGSKRAPPQSYFEIAGLASAVKWRKIQNMVEEEHF